MYLKLAYSFPPLDCGPLKVELMFYVSVYLRFSVYSTWQLENTQK